MNVTWRIKNGDEALEKKFIEEAKAAGLSSLKGHRSVGGIRASIYNAFPMEGVDALVEFMKNFEKANG
jgi:phosphoserine aminotransferase